MKYVEYHTEIHQILSKQTNTMRHKIGHDRGSREKEKGKMSREKQIITTTKK